MGLGSRRTEVVILVLALVVVAGFALTIQPPWSTPAPAQADDVTQPTPASVKLVEIDPSSSTSLWPYTSRQRSFETATLPINVVVFRNAGDVRAVLARSDQATWRADDPVAANGTAGNTTGVESGIVFNGTTIEWTSADGSTRYTYLHDQTTGTGHWVDESYQLHDGTYLGSRYHLRLYDGGQGQRQWTAIQGHREHWDWFRLRHTVGSVDRAQRYLESEFDGTAAVASLERRRFANGGALDADGWVTIVRLVERPDELPQPASLGLVLWLVSIVWAAELDWRTIRRAFSAENETAALVTDYLRLAVVLALYPVAVRVAGITLETGVPTLSPKPIAGVLYPVLVFGIPIGTYRLARSLHPERGAVVAAASLGAGFLVDYSYLGITALPIEIVIHRSVLLVAIGVVASAAARPSPPTGRRHWLLYLGIALWVVGLLFPLLDVY